MSSHIARLRQYFISQEVFATLQPLFLFTYIYGLTPFRIVKRRNGTSEIRASCFGFCNTVAYVTLYGVCFLNSLLNAESVVGYFFRTNISVVGDTLQICTGIVTGIVIYTTALTQRSKMRRIIDVFNELDEHFASIGVRVKYSRIYRYALLLSVTKTLIIGIYCAGVYLLLRSVHVKPSFCVCVAFVLQHSVLVLAICLFSFMARGFERRLVIVNKVGGELWV
ncbi:putative gustatory receptor 28b [Anastrepha obliqua]|uniref:putative gustatory receptor 28b n=1 Tax=Anastrepha obliqua TaxID=95512 RepID=UPI002409E089|nr:putative gustatory receptor 28b [Anastrepha obliqua]